MVELSRHETLLLRVFDSIDDQVSTMPNEDIELNRDLLLTNFLKHLEQQLNASLKEFFADYNEIEHKLGQLGEPETPDEVRIESSLKRKRKHLASRLNEMDSSMLPIRQHLRGKVVYALNIRYAEVMA